MRRTIKRQIQNQKLYLRGSVPLHEFCPSYLLEEPEGYPSVSCGNSGQIISSGHPLQSIIQYFGSRQSEQKLTNLCRFCSSSYNKGWKISRHRFLLSYRTESGGLRPGFFDYRPLSGSFPLGRVPDTPRVSDQILYYSSNNHRRFTSLLLPHGSVLQMNKAASKDQSILWNHQENHEDSNLDHRLRLHPCSHHQKAPKTGLTSLCNFTAFNRYPIRKMAIFVSTFKYQLERTRSTEQQ